MNGLGSLITRMMVVVALTVALASSGLAHRFVSPEADADLSAYLAAGGSFDDICGDDGQGTVGRCDACRLVDVSCLANMDRSFVPYDFRQASIDPFLVKIAPRDAVFDPFRAVRAPPVI